MSEWQDRVNGAGLAGGIQAESGGKIFCVQALHGSGCYKCYAELLENTWKGSQPWQQITRTYSFILMIFP